MSRTRRIQLLGGVIVVAVSLRSPPPSWATVREEPRQGSDNIPHDDSGSTTTPSPAIDSPAAITALFAGIPQHGDTLGQASAPVTMVVFEDPQCPFCDQWNLETLPSVVSQFVRPGKIKLVYRGILVIGPNSVSACGRSSRPARRTSSGT